MIKKLIEALRSGKYKQTSGKLKVRDTFCILGVACDVSERGQWTEYDDYKIKQGANFTYSMPPDLRNEYGFDNSTTETLVAMNEDKESFETIADYLEKKYITNKEQ